MKRLLFFLSTVFAVAFALIIGLRMSPDAMAVIIGIICGVLASIPTSALMVWVMRQRDKQLETQYGGLRPNHYPPVVVVNGQGPNGYSNPSTAPLLAAGAARPGSREFKVIGQENTETVGEVLPSFWDQDG